MEMTIIVTGLSLEGCSSNKGGDLGGYIVIPLRIQCGIVSDNLRSRQLLMSRWPDVSFAA